MCSDRPSPTPSAFIRNLKQPMPTAEKLRLLARNAWIKISRAQQCCGHPGEPGC